MAATEFMRWRDAPAGDRPRIAAQQIARHEIGELMADPRRFDLAVAISPNGKRFADCTSAELGS
jgi:hypothetical protein